MFHLKYISIDFNYFEFIAHAVTGSVKWISPDWTIVVTLQAAVTPEPVRPAAP